MTRLPDPVRDDLPQDARDVYDRIATSRGGARGPYAMLMHHPALADAVAQLGEQLRFRSVLPGADRELAILVAGREVEALYEWAAHEPIALREGTRPEAIDVARAGGDATEGLTDRERIIVETVRAMYRRRRLTDEEYAHAEGEFGREGTIELVTLAGFYGMIGFVLNAFEVDLPQGVSPAFERPKQS